VDVVAVPGDGAELEDLHVVGHDLQLGQRQRQRGVDELLAQRGRRAHGRLM